MLLTSSRLLPATLRLLLKTVQKKDTVHKKVPTANLRVINIANTVSLPGIFLGEGEED